MRRFTSPSPDRRCQKCDFKISETRRADAAYCSQSCRAVAEKLRYKRRNPAYVERQNNKVKELRHRTTFGHTDFIDDPTMNQRDKFRHAQKLGYRSGLEVAVARDLKENGVDAEYETHKVHFTYPARETKYTPDWVLPNGIVIETKGRYVVADRKKHLIIKEQHPNLDIRFVFSNSRSRISKGSSTTYAMWCEKHGFRYADKKIPKEWMKEKSTTKRLKALKEAGIK